MNCKGIEHLPNTPAKSSSQFGPAKKPRTNLSQKSGRAVPFSRPSVVGRLKGKNMTETNNDQMPSRASLLVSFKDSVTEFQEFLKVILVDINKLFLGLCVLFYLCVSFI